MEDSSLNLAHQQQRRAESLVRRRKYPQAIKCHERATEHLEEALRQTYMPRSLESLSMQQDYHISQIKIIKSKREQYELFKRAMEMERLAKIAGNQDYETPDAVKLKFYDALNNADSLLDMLAKRRPLSDSDSTKSDASLEGHAIEAIEGLDIKTRPKDTHTIIAELQSSLQTLRAMMMDLTAKYDETVVQNEVYAARIKKLEAIVNKPMSPKPVPPASELKIFRNLPYFSSSESPPQHPGPCGKHRPCHHFGTPPEYMQTPNIVRADTKPPPENTGFHILPEFKDIQLREAPHFSDIDLPEIPPLPPLPPLEMPEFDPALLTSTSMDIPIPRMIIQDGDGYENSKNKKENSENE